MPLDKQFDDYEVFFLSYDEPNASENYNDIVCKLSQQCFSRIPPVKRVHGIKGIDNAHKTCAKLATRKYFITVDADCKVDPTLFKDVLPYIEASETSVITFPAKNSVNGLVYGNGSLKIWPVDLVINSSVMGIDYCYSLPYKRAHYLNKCYVATFANATPKQAWRSGFREGAKLVTINGNPSGKLSDISKSNLKRLRVWCSIGADTQNGYWTMLGARQGIMFSLENASLGSFQKMSYLINDFDWLNTRFSSVFPDNNIEEDSYICSLLDENEKLLSEKYEFEVMSFTSQASRIFKLSYFNPKYILNQNDWVKIHQTSNAGF